MGLKKTNIRFALLLRLLNNPITLTWHLERQVVKKNQWQ